MALKKIIVEEKLDEENLEIVKNIYKTADIVYGYKPNSFSRLKFNHIYNSKIFLNAVD